MKQYNIIISVSVSKRGTRYRLQKIEGGCIDWWWYLDTCIDYLSMVTQFIHYSSDCVVPDGPRRVFQCWMLSVAGGSWVSQRSVVVV